jgi:hypothetical protein
MGILNKAREEVADTVISRVSGKSFFKYLPFISPT